MDSRIFQALLLVLLPLIHATVSNRTIDDTFGDLATGEKPIYLPGPWQRPDCIGCAVKPSVDGAMNHTYSAITWHNPPTTTPVSIEFSFQGTAVYVYFILANFVGDNIPTQTVCDFALDGSYVSSFHHIPTSSTEFNYGALVFSKDNLSNEQHTLNISTSGLNELLWVCFDYATYTFDDTLAAVTQQQSNTPSTSSPSSSVTQQQSPTALTSSDNSRSATIGAIVGGTVGGISILANIVFILLCLRQRKHKSFPSSPAGNADETFTTQGLQPFSSIQGEQQAAVLIPRRPTLSSTTSNNEISSTSVMSMRQAEIEDQIRGLTREMQALAGEKNASIKRPLPIPPSSTYHNSHGERNYTDQIQKQMDTMRGEIEYLQAQLHSDWARGLTDNLPPGYHA